MSFTLPSYKHMFWSFAFDIYNNTGNICTHVYYICKILIITLFYFDNFFFFLGVLYKNINIVFYKKGQKCKRLCVMFSSYFVFL